MIYVDRIIWSNDTVQKIWKNRAITISQIYKSPISLFGVVFFSFLANKLKLQAHRGDT